MADKAAPTSEIGLGASVGTLTWGTFVDDTERVPELRHPRSVIEYDKMRNDSQVDALNRGYSLPVRRMHYSVDPNGASDSITRMIAEDLGLPVKGETEFDDISTNFNHDDNLRHALLALLYGSYFGEISGEVIDGWWRLRKIAPRMPLTIDKIDVEPDGGLKGIRQNITRPDKASPTGITRVAPLIATKNGVMPGPLVAFVWEREGANWAGRSVLRSLYGNWLIKQRLLRVDATKHERNGMGVPVARTTVEGVGRKALALAAKAASRLRVGQNVGGALPYGIDLDLKGVQGNLPDTLASIKYHDEAMARALLMMFIQLGQTETGSRALGDSFIDFFALFLDFVADWYCGVMNKYVLRRWVIWNVGESSPSPKLVFEPLPPELAAADLINMVDKGVLTVDDETEGWIRGKYRIPKLNGTRPAPAAAPAKARGRVRAASNADSPIPLPDRELHRQPLDFEVKAAVDYKTMDAEFESAVAKLVDGWQGVRTGHINELVDVIAQTDSTDLAALSAIAAQSGGGVVLLEEVMHEQAENGAAGAVAEAKAQGKTDAVAPDLSDTKASLSAQAAATDTLLARSISEAGARKASSLGGGALGSDAIANEVKTYLDGLSDAYLEEQFTGVVAQAQNSGRRAVMAQEEPSTIYASELLDRNTCTNCKGVDGKEYESLDAATEDYPTGGYKDCLGGPKCRGTLVGVYEEAS